MENKISYDDFMKVDIRVGKLVDAQEFPEAKVPALKLTIDFGPEIGIKKSSAQIVGAYKKEELIGMLVIGVVNFPPKQVGPFISEVLTLGFKNQEGDGFILAVPDRNTVELGDRMR